ncbi:uncharacterized protein LOC130445993 [Diorhabda sublineata]|uniref:uncharacterized protein LOC130445993 n=1 Tax=Diorhabda sublineata TaxID=1163346 RepID=UPI0024E0EC12|nr:uncharacterized protein LOC130445993 [Diorhabda sublineata]
MMHKQRLNQAQTEKYQYAKGQLFSCYNKLKGIMSENKMMRNMLLNNNRSCHSNAGAFMTSTPSVTNDGMSTFTPIVPNTKQIPGYAQRLQTFDIRRNPDQQNINRNIRPNVNLISENGAAMNDDVISQDYGTDVSLQLQTPILDKNKEIHGYSRIYHGRGGSRGMPIPHNQPHLNSGGGGGMLYKRSEDVTASQHLAHNRRLNMVGVHRDHMQQPNTANSMRELHGKRT